MSARKQKPKPDQKPPAKPKRHRLNWRQCRLFMNDIREFGYPVTFDEIRKIADEVADGTYDNGDPVALILVRQIDEVFGKPGGEARDG